MQNVNLTCVVFGLPTPDVTWNRFDLATIPADSSKFATYTSSSPVPTGGMEGRSVLQINAVNGSDTGNYTCTGVNQPLGLDTPTVIDSAVLDLLVQSKLIDLHAIQNLVNTFLGVLLITFLLLFLLSLSLFVSLSVSLCLSLSLFL